MKLINRWAESSNRSLEILNASTASPANVQGHPWSGHNCQRWLFELVKAPGTSDPYDFGWRWVFGNVRQTKNIYSGYKRSDRPDHYAIDLSNTAGYPIDGTEIRSPASGKVVMLWTGHASIGNGVMVETNNVDPNTGKKIRVRFIHMKATPTVLLNQTVSVGTKLGNVGSTGNSTGPHLDLAMTKDGSTSISLSGSINPQRFFNFIPFTGKTSTAA